ncbi:unnamed protein product [Cylicocyclus nassatus]|uniref:Uncharacterized protein n=1 Tax=Cylicocyclus nassatus TaxID=53992 RepID=A0AA36HGQ2_CYLNA|nr:unnamed protein product [Cylicocyclus nassatus]
MDQTLYRFVALQEQLPYELSSGQHAGIVLPPDEPAPAEVSKRRWEWALPSYTLHQVK